MRFTETTLKGSFVIEQTRLADARGFFARTWCTREFQAHGLVSRFVQSNMSFSKRRGTLRGLHYQAAPHQEAKLIRCVKGAIYDVIVDLRPDSPTYLKWFGVELTGGDDKMLYVPEGFAHGFQTLVDDTEVVYPVSEFYAPHSERGIRWDDPLFAITWPHVEARVTSRKDQSWPPFVPAPYRGAETRSRVA
jgi:dTDP-4-dehydrorhamnose 3,5-epimerase